MPQVFAYVGAKPNGLPPPALSTVPIPPSGDPNSIFNFVLAFATADSNGNYTPVWDASITPGVIEQLKNSNSNIAFWASLAGANSPWTPVAAANQSAWISNATSTLANIINTYGLNGIDVDYEDGVLDATGVVDQSFLVVMGQILQNLLCIIPKKAEVFQRLSYAPYHKTNNAYVSLYQQQSAFVQINYQTYASGAATVEDYINLYNGSNGLTSQYNLQDPSNPLALMGLGIDSSTTAPRGLQPPDIYTVWNQLTSNIELGPLSSASIWCLEYSASNGYPVEKTLITNWVTIAA